jgi:hypothetical protein
MTIHRATQKALEDPESSKAFSFLNGKYNFRKEKLPKKIGNKKVAQSWDLCYYATKELRIG